MLHSLWCLERQFERILERSDTFSFLKNHYIFTHDVNVPVELHEGVELWGVAYLEYRAGRRSVLY